ncbi:MAG TPA: tripartite tricarboxylate transporter substrate binding protein [Burkholderiales bacterium]|jgi:tripartite-type tricarboxylate transporter receptor subunit TctC|nr:tripartite tricarboxylate transporter substrate binding protein [Burkholderiales bacterium]
MKALFAVSAVAGLFTATIAHAAETKYPVKPITCIVAVEAGADGDVLVRPILTRMSKLLGQPILVVNKPGGGSSIGYRELHGAKPDGYTIGWGSATIITNKIQGVSPFDHHDFTQLGAYATYFPIVISSTRSKVQFNTIQEAISYAKANPGKVNISTAGVGQSWWIAAMSLIGGTGISVNAIPQPGAGAMTVAQVAGGHAELGVAALGSAKSMIDAGQVKFLATLGDARAPAPYDKYPTAKELGYNVSWESTNFLMAPPKMPKEVVAVLADAVEKSVKDPEYIKFANERNTRWEYIAPDKVVPMFDQRSTAVRDIMTKAGIVKDAK